ncbi:hypothetical protein M2152_002108 [Microbacteriaceae bacterium SG_E_30_P1]|uniref:DUF3105 domain-containing protein n=1 Tax=Antiquaquibacter oligotrophicus TaxID=2880260 RepID=A0ABT6KPK4_9MICO|nr:DUF3105 domain-containing protein [Antiquaquibacter oligotrophicus]MDH6181926.1 hypothetical protein [Antiquaquibacter oligotrophicus]UDF12403.1 DUF3105 domain-containing protein [Antiquaquibacter oligotrophicus]
MSDNSQKLTVKQQREAQRAAKVAALKKKQAAEKRTRTIGIAAAIVGAIAVVALIVTFVVIVPSTQPQSAPDPVASGDPGDIEIEGLITYDDLTANHVEDVVTYTMTPPAGGDHSATWLNCGVYTEPVPDMNAVHSLEHGAVWVTYNPDDIDADAIAELRTQLPSSYIVISPYDGLDSPLVASAWGAQVPLDSVTDERLQSFLQKYWQSPTGPEPGAPCTGGVDGPGQIA